MKNLHSFRTIGLSLALVLASAVVGGCSSTDDKNDGAGGSGGEADGTAGAGELPAICTAVADVDCAKAGKVYQAICDLGCDNVGDCANTTAQDVEDACNGFKDTEDDRTMSYACNYTNPDSCEDFNSCFQACPAL
jgi:hypothetical protein